MSVCIHYHLSKISTQIIECIIFAPYDLLQRTLCNYITLSSHFICPPVIDIKLSNTIAVPFVTCSITALSALLLPVRQQHCCYLFVNSTAATCSSTALLLPVRQKHCCYLFVNSSAATCSTTALLLPVCQQHCCYLFVNSSAATCSLTAVL